ncbi:MAG: hypothetical protein ISS35_03815, partial [Kiritimatiellae bacterium]|nr:hypothetical protein [Kiritimatiellia bacterium]
FSPGAHAYNPRAVKIHYRDPAAQQRKDLSVTITLGMAAKAAGPSLVVMTPPTMTAKRSAMRPHNAKHFCEATHHSPTREHKKINRQKDNVERQPKDSQHGIFHAAPLPTEA